MYCDTHAHISSEKYRDDAAEVVRSAIGAGLVFIVDAGCDVESSHRSLELASEHEAVYATVGVHPHEAGKVTDGELAELLALHEKPKVVAIGEMGLDYHYDHSPRQRQREVFSQQVAFALEHARPIVVHARDAVQEAIDILARDFGRFPAGVFHCFAGDYRQAARLLDEGLYVSFAGPLTFKKNDQLRALAGKLPLDRVLVETDCPYLTPEPHRGRRNLPEHVRLVVAELARIHGVTPEEAARATTKSAAALFGIPLPAAEA